MEVDLHHARAQQTIKPTLWHPCQNKKAARKGRLLPFHSHKSNDYDSVRLIFTYMLLLIFFLAYRIAHAWRRLRSARSSGPLV